MSQENVDLIRRIYEDGLFDNDPDQLIPLLSPEVELVNPSDAVEGGVRRGINEVLRAQASVSESFESGRHDLQELFGSDEVIVASVSFCARPRGAEGDFEIRQEEAHTWTLRDGKIVRLEWGRDLPSALEAAGLSE